MHTESHDACGIKTSLVLEQTNLHARNGASESHLVGVPDLGEVFRHSGWQRQRKRVYDAMVRTGASPRRICRFAGCGMGAWVEESTVEPGVYRVRSCACGDRWCLPCTRARSRRLASEIAALTAGEPCRMVTLTIRTDTLTLTQALDKLYGAYSRLQRTQLWRKTVTAAIAILEITRNATRNTWHPHLHVLAQGRFIPHQELKAAWYRTTGDSSIVDIRLVREARKIREYVTKYCSKPLDASWQANPDLLQEAMRALHGRRLVITTGAFRGSAGRDKRQRAEAQEDRSSNHGDWRPVASLAAVLQGAAAGDTRMASIAAALPHGGVQAANRLLAERSPPRTQPDVRDEQWIIPLPGLRPYGGVV